jgi:hypothetical protein
VARAAGLLKVTPGSQQFLLRSPSLCPIFVARVGQLRLLKTSHVDFYQVTKKKSKNTEIIDRESKIPDLAAMFPDCPIEFPAAP